jgi:hypothetical protein
VPRQRVVVGYGKGALAIIDPVSPAKTGDIRLPGHPESFQFAENGTQVFVNVPDFHQIAIVDLPSGAVRSVPNEGLRANFPMAVDAEAHRVLVAFRGPPVLLALTKPGGTHRGQAGDLRRRRRCVRRCQAPPDLCELR